MVFLCAKYTPLSYSMLGYGRADYAHKHLRIVQHWAKGREKEEKMR